MVLIPRSLYNAYLTQGDRTVREAISSINIRQLNNISDNVKASLQNNDIVKGQPGNLPNPGLNPPGPPPASNPPAPPPASNPPAPPPPPPPPPPPLPIAATNFGQTNVPVPNNFGQIYNGGTHAIVPPSSSSNTGLFGQNVPTQTVPPKTSGMGVQTNIPTHSMGVQTIIPASHNMAVQTGLIGQNVPTQTVPPKTSSMGVQTNIPTHTMGVQTIVPASHNMAVQTGLNGQNVSTQTVPPKTSGMSVQTEETARRDQRTGPERPTDGIAQTDALPKTFEVGTQSLKRDSVDVQTDVVTVNDGSSQTVETNVGSTQTHAPLTHESGTSPDEHSVWDYSNQRRQNRRRNAVTGNLTRSIVTQTEPGLEVSSVLSQTDAPKKPVLSIVSQKGESIAPKSRPVSSTSSQTDALKKPVLSIVSQKGESIAPTPKPRPVSRRTQTKLPQIGSAVETQTESPEIGATATQTEAKKKSLSIASQPNINISPKKKVLSTVVQEGVNIEGEKKIKPRLGFTTLSPTSFVPAKKKTADASGQTNDDEEIKAQQRRDARHAQEIKEHQEEIRALKQLQADRAAATERERAEKKTVDGDAQTDAENFPVALPRISTEAQTDPLHHFQTVTNPKDIVGRRDSEQEPSWEFDDPYLGDAYMGPPDATLESIVVRSPVRRTPHISNLPRLTPRPHRALKPPQKYSPSPIKKKGGSKKKGKEVDVRMEEENVTPPVSEQPTSAVESPPSAGGRGGAKKRTAAMRNYEELRGEERRVRLEEQRRSAANRARWIPSSSTAQEPRVRIRKKTDKKTEDTSKKPRNDD
jgi:hypothetical protein